MKWQGDPELLRYRERLVSNTLRLVHYDGQDLTYEDIPEPIQERMESMYRADGSMICKLCGITYNRHPGFPWSVVDGGADLRELCNGDLVHL